MATFPWFGWQQSLVYAYTDGTITFKGYFAWDDSNPNPRPAVIISHAFGGRGEFECEKARKLAELGYVGFAIDMYGEAKQSSVTEECFALMQPLIDDREMLQQRITLALSTVREQTEVDSAQIAAIGFCFGGLCALDLARTGADVKGVASFHGLFTPPDNTKGNQITAKVLCLHGYADPMVPPQDLIDLGTELTAAGADWQVHAYGNTLHAFTNPQANDPDFGAVYNNAADKRSWISLVHFLEEIFE